MTDNPYEAPDAQAGNLDHEMRARVSQPRNPLRFPARILVLLSAIGLFVVVNAVPRHVASFDHVNLEGARSTGSIVQSLVIITTAFFLWGAVLVGAVSMLRFKSYRTAWIAAIVATIPLLSPLLVLGIPFGIWAMVLLVKPDVKARFTR